MKRAIQKAVLTTARATGLTLLLRPVAAGAGAILTFHRVRPATAEAFAPNAHLEVTPAFLKEVVDWAARHGIDIVSLDEAIRRLRKGGDRFLVLTFDDGFRDNLEIALPILRAAEAPFAVYVATGFTERSANPWWMTLEEVVRRADAVAHPDRSGRTLPAASTAEKNKAAEELAAWLRSVSETEQRAAADWLAERHGVDVGGLVDAAFMTWDELRELAAEPLATIGAHTHNHVALAKLGRDEARAEVLRSADLLETHLGARPRHFAYPYGYPSAVGARDHRLLAELEFDTAVLTSPGVLRPGNLAAPTALPRISMNGHFQKRRYLEALVSGVPFLPGAFRRGEISRAKPDATARPASASSG